MTCAVYYTAAFVVLLHSQNSRMMLSCSICSAHNMRQTSAASFGMAEKVAFFGVVCSLNFHRVSFLVDSTVHIVAPREAVGEVRWKNDSL